MASHVPTVLASARHTATVIFLHGLGDTGHGWCEGFAQIKSDHIKYMCPTASTMPVSINMGMRMPSWFDIYGLSADSKEDEVGIKKAADKIRAMIDVEIQNGIPSHRIILGGFSQGGALALYTALTHKEKLGGIVALSSFLPLHKAFPKECGPTKDSPIFQAHGDGDPVVPYLFGVMSSEVLKTFCSKSEFKTYRGLQHGSSTEEMRDVKGFIERVLPSDGKL